MSIVNFFLGVLFFFLTFFLSNCAELQLLRENINDRLIDLKLQVFEDVIGKINNFFIVFTGMSLRFSLYIDKLLASLMEKSFRLLCEKTFFV